MMRLAQWIGRKLLPAGFALLLGGVLPFLCWGSSADPAHPHMMPHFVFREPLTHVHIGVTLPHTDVPEEDESNAPAGAAHPATLLLTLLGVALGATWHWPRPRGWRGARRAAGLPVRALWLPVPTPPPRGCPAVVVGGLV